jgi:hypothetical protein
VTAQEAAESAVLTLDDLPSGWTVAPPGDDGGDASVGDDFVYSGECDTLNEDEFPGEIASAESADFEGAQSQEVSSTASVFSDEAVAQEAFAELDSAFSLCRDQFVAAFEQGLLGEGDQRDFDASQLEVSLEDLAFPEMGDSTTAYRLAGSMNLEGLLFEFTVDFVFMRAGRMAGGFSYMTFGDVNSIEEEVLAEITAEKMAAANASLTE